VTSHWWRYEGQEAGKAREPESRKAGKWESYEPRAMSNLFVEYERADLWAFRIMAIINEKCKMQNANRKLNRADHLSKLPSRVGKEKCKLKNEKWKLDIGDR